ncbi:LPXTG cell wall anchor domain-containing protein [Rathayibacter festucae]|uniref:Gram-positive cocci surface proteins LPxTG domain-containing protein n=1 Tax=Rathayibacter festucae DSM 15932 TaxID=1328866 RepID=A0A3T0T304_9MICO|nr:LPXTG cell wall anchor domain-containing protein [Rathayibacter festucae]AZZ52962.1 hypothetical protein C1I64_13555 [Rathayibacter festucae DSM 15932]
MNRSTRPLRPLLGCALAATAAVGLALTIAAPASADTPYDPLDWQDAILFNGGGISIDAGPEYAGYDVFVQAQLPVGARGSRGEWVLKKASLDAEGDALVHNFAGPLNLYFFSPSSPEVGLELPEPAATAAIYRNEEIAYDVDPAAGTAVVDGDVPSVTPPALENFEIYLADFTDASVAPSSYLVGESFDLTFSDLYWATEGDLDGLATSTVIYSEPTTIGTSAIADGAVTTTIGAEYTTEPHTLALMDDYGRVLASATLDGGAAAGSEPVGTTEPTTPSATPVAAAPASSTGSKPGGPRLAETGLEGGATALLGSALLLAGGAGLVVARRRRARA